MSLRNTHHLLQRTYLGALLLTALLTLVGYAALSYSIETAPTAQTLQLERIFVALMLLMLALEGLLIFRPVEKLLREQTSALRESETRYEAVIAAMAEGMVIQDASGAITLCNPAAERLLGLTHDRMMGRTSVDPRWHAVHEDGSPFPGDTHPAMITLKTGDPQHAVVMGIHNPDSALRWILINSMPLRTPGSSAPYAVVTTFADITHQRALQAIEVENKTLQAQIEKEQELSGLKSRMMERIAHEFRTPLALIQLATDTYMRYYDRMSKEQQLRKDTTIRHNIQRLTDMLDEIGMVVRGSLAPTALNSIPINVHQLCKEVQANLEAQFELPGKYALDIPADLTIDADPFVLGRSTYHLMRNAARFSPSETTVDIHAQVTSDGFELRICNRGIGIPTAELTRVFEPFYRGTNIGETSGLGLGLTIAQAGVVAHGGRIRAESIPGEATTFILWLPVRHG